jgi:hypothetical protein
MFRFEFIDDDSRVLECQACGATSPFASPIELVAWAYGHLHVCWGSVVRWRYDEIRLPLQLQPAERDWLASWSDYLCIDEGGTYV